VQSEADITRWQVLNKKLKCRIKTTRVSLSHTLNHRVLEEAIMSFPRVTSDPVLSCIMSVSKILVGKSWAILIKNRS
jgi:hypothetical protein